MRAFIAGATGYTGQQVVKQWAAQGHEAYAHVRASSSSASASGDELKALGAKVLVTLWELEAICAALEQAQPHVVFFLIGTTKARMSALKAQGKPPEEASYEAIDYGLAALLLKACRQSAPTARFVYLSAMGVSAYAPGEYMKVRWRFEQELIASGQPFVIARPGLITGPDREDDRPMERVSGAISGALVSGLARLGASKLARQYRPTDAAELARALVKAGLEPEAQGLTLEAADLKDDSPAWTP